MAPSLQSTSLFFFNLNRKCPFHSKNINNNNNENNNNITQPYNRRASVISHKVAESFRQEIVIALFQSKQLLFVIEVVKVVMRNWT